MRVILKPGRLIVVPETAAEAESYDAWRQAALDHVFAFGGPSAKGGTFADLGPHPEACREPINVVFGEGNPAWYPIGNLAETPFTFRNMPFSSVEGFWQGLKFENPADRARVAALWGRPAKAAARDVPTQDRFVFDGETHAVGGPGHHALMLQACKAKFTQHALARAALLATGERPLTHRTRRDSPNIPGALMADIWMRIRRVLRSRTDGALEDGAAPEPADRILYFGRDRDHFGFMSHFHPSPITLDGEIWPTVEHYYQTQKSHDPMYKTAIREAKTGKEAKQLSAAPVIGRPSATMSWFLLNDQQPRADWSVVKLDIMRRADQAKFTQNAELGARLLATGTIELVEDSPFDAFWGIGRDGRGLNWAGRVLMEIREALRSGTSVSGGGGKA